MLKLCLALCVISIGLTACVSNQYSKPLNLRFQEKSELYSQNILVKRTAKLCLGENAKQQNCPIDFYVDHFKAGQFFIDNSAQFFLRPDAHNFEVRNCNTDGCESCSVDLNPKNLKNKEFILSIDDEDKPFILNDGKPLSCTDRKGINK